MPQGPSPAAMAPRGVGGYFTSQGVAESIGGIVAPQHRRKESPACRDMTDSKIQHPVRCRLVRCGFAMTWKLGTAFVSGGGEERSRGAGFRWREPAELWSGQGFSGVAVQGLGRMGFRGRWRGSGFRAGKMAGWRKVLKTMCFAPLHYCFPHFRRLNPLESCTRAIAPPTHGGLRLISRSIRGGVELSFRIGLVESLILGGLELRPCRRSNQ